MPDLRFSIEEANAVPYAAVPQLSLRLKIENRPADEEIHAVLLRCQIQLDTPRRSYHVEQRERLVELFGEPARWGTSLRPIPWTEATLSVPGFSGSTALELPLPVSFDLSAAATKYLSWLEDGEVPITMLLSGTVFYQAQNGLQVTRVPWDREVRFSFSTRIWQALNELYYPNHTFVSLRRDLFERLDRYRLQEGLASADDALDRLLARRLS